MSTPGSRLAHTVRVSFRRQAWLLRWLDHRLHAGSVANAESALATERARARERREALAAVQAVVRPEVPAAVRPDVPAVVRPDVPAPRRRRIDLTDGARPAGTRSH